MRLYTCLLLLTLAVMPASAQGGLNSGGRPLSLHKEASASDIIYNTPAGTLHSGLYRQSVGFFYGAKRVADGMSGTYVVASDKKTYYIQNIFSQYQCGSWVKGTLTGDTIYVATPQHIDYFEDNGEVVNIYLRNLKYDKLNDTYVVDSANTEAKFVMSGDTLKQVSDQLLGMTDQKGTYMLYGDYNLMMFPNKDEVVKVPSGLKSERYELSYKDEHGESQKKLVRLAVGNSDVWLGDFSMKYPKAWVKGTLKDKRITFSNGQYLGYTDSHHIYFVTGVTVPVTDPDTGEAGETFELSRNIRFDADGDAYKSDNVMFTNWGKQDVNYKECFDQPRLTKFVLTEQTPSNPVIQGYQAYDNDNKYGSLSFTIPSVSNTGVALDPDSLFYNIYTDERLLTFKTTKYGLDRDMTDIPFDFTDGHTFAASASDPLVRIVYFKERVGTYYKRIGVQAIYHGLGKAHKSAIVYNDGTEVAGDDPVTAVTEVVMPAGRPTVSYYDLAGRRVLKPENGVYIKSERLADGVIRQRKIIVR